MTDSVVADISMIISGVAMMISGWNTQDIRPRLAPTALAIGFVVAVAGVSLLTWRLGTGAR
ncbi:hypothetical protein [Mycolicibacterium mucogenicum]|jgi:hypothetical protein|uniref:hypothetical protein n=1 Tax=Mycolicibacterium mucogenicum TaxID=56689 RepID=UPI000AC0CDF6|nr:hypothetical protein [Mycolicibacterium mucogenicum]